MPKLNFVRDVPFSPEQMLALVADLDAYPSFVPNCTEMQVSADGDGVAAGRLARMGIRFGPISQAYTSRVTIDPANCSLRATAIDGPFSYLDSQWQFIAKPDGTRVSFDIDFGFSNPLIAAAANPAFAAKQDEILDAFIAEAQRRYG